MWLIGKNKDFKAYFDCNEQKYFVFKSNKQIATGYKYSEIRSYLN
jgi:hypothetical protein